MSVSTGRTPQGVRGLKPNKPGNRLLPPWSHSARSAWIETGLAVKRKASYLRRTPQGVRGLKRQNRLWRDVYSGRTPQGVRGLKLRAVYRPFLFFWSHSARSAWIETQEDSAREQIDACRTPQGVRGLKPKMRLTPTQEAGRTPQGVRGLKRFPTALFAPRVKVALRKECVD